MTPRLLIFISTSLLCAFPLSGAASSKQLSSGSKPPSDREIVVGQTAVLEGPSAALGRGMRAGLEACFAEANAEGGINAQKIRLITKDDGYEPDRAIDNARALVRQDKALLLIGSVGTPTAKAILPICDDLQVPLLAPFTGAGLLRDPFRKQVINLRASYAQEMERLAQHLVEVRGLTRIACMYQNDDYGAAGLKGLESALAKRELQLVSSGTYERNTTAIKCATLDIRKGKPEAIVQVGTYKACAEFIKLAQELGMGSATFCNISFVGAKALAQELGSAGEGVVISQVVPAPMDDSIPVVREYLAALRQYQPDEKPDWISLEGYLAGRLFCELAKRVDGPITRDKLLAAVANADNLDLSGFTLQFSPKDHQGSDSVYLTEIRTGQVIPLP